MKAVILRIKQSLYESQLYVNLLFTKLPCFVDVIKCNPTQVGPEKSKASLFGLLAAQNSSHIQKIQIYVTGSIFIGIRFFLKCS